VLIPSTDAYVTCICDVGSKSISHVLSSIERCKERLLAIGPRSEAARIQIVQSVVDYWQQQPGNAVNIVDKLLNYTIVSPMCVVLWALAPERLAAGHALADSYVYEMVGHTVSKVTNRVRQIAAARLQVHLPAEQIAMLQETLVKERAGMRQLFSVIDDATAGVAAGAVDALIAMTDDAEIDQLKGWGDRWRRVFARKAAVEEAITGENAMELRIKGALENVAKEKAAREAAEAEEEANRAAAEANGAGNGAGNSVEMDTDGPAEPLDATGAVDADELM
jgi:nuclear cap-binding protein subunit 1